VQESSMVGGRNALLTSFEQEAYPRRTRNEVATKCTSVPIKSTHDTPMRSLDHCQQDSSIMIGTNKDD
jgi:hypothetical protein